MVTKRNLVTGIIIAVAGVAIFLLFVDWDARAIKKTLHTIEKELAWTPRDNELTVGGRINRIQNKIGETCEVYIPAYEVTKTFTRNDVTSYLMLARRHYNKLSVKFHDLQIQFIQVPQSRVVTTAYVKTTTYDNKKHDEALFLEINLRKVEKEWQIFNVKEVPVLEK